MKTHGPSLETINQFGGKSFTMQFEDLGSDPQPTHISQVGVEVTGNAKIQEAETGPPGEAGSLG